MFSTLIESRAIRTRRTGGAVMSTLLHGAIVAGAIALTQRSPANATEPPERVPLVYAPLQRAPEPTTTHASAPQPTNNIPRPRIDVVIPAPNFVPTSIPPIAAGPEIPPDRIGTGGVPQTGVISTTPLATGGVVNVEQVERAPSVLGQPRAPRYPSILRETGTAGQVVIRFVIDTLGRAELGDITVLESSHALFTEAVKAALPEYRFSPGEVGGRKVRTLVQMPFAFSIK